MIGHEFNTMDFCIKCGKSATELAVAFRSGKDTSCKGSDLPLPIIHADFHFTPRTVTVMPGKSWQVAPTIYDEPDQPTIVEGSK